MNGTCNDGHCGCCASGGAASGHPPWDDGPPPDDDATWARWPCCPECGRRRQTFCPTCQLAGDDFRLAEFIPVAAPLEPTRDHAESDDPLNADSVLLMCPSCDEAFAPQFYRRCPQCGFQFEDGVELSEAPESLLTGRAVAVLLGLAMLVIAIVVYFWFLVR